MSKISQMTTYQAGLIQAKAYRSLNIFFGSALEQHGLTMSEWALLGTVRDAGEVTTTHLAEQLSVKVPRITLQTKKLEQEKLVSRIDSPKDSRVTMISLTPAGVALVEDTEKSLRAAMRNFLHDVDRVQLAIYLRVLSKLASKLEG